VTDKAEQGHRGGRHRPAGELGGVEHVMTRGYSIVPGGKGSHIRLRAPGRPVIIVPASREALPRQVLASVASAFSLPSPGAPRTALG
jgi:predicted RNA binding protein YcfA (HicA-like mRNA interferase family)